MTLRYAPLIIPVLLTVASGLGLGLYSWRHRYGREGVPAFALACFCCALWALGDAVRWASADMGWQHFWAQFRRPGEQGG